jgi:hypothetical protein
VYLNSLRGKRSAYKCYFGNPPRSFYHILYFEELGIDGEEMNFER